MGSCKSETDGELSKRERNKYEKGNGGRDRLESREGRQKHKSRNKGGEKGEVKINKER